MSMRFSSDAGSLGHAAAPTDLAVAQFLELAKLANVRFEVQNERLVMVAARPDARLWKPIRPYLDELGAAAIADYLKRNGPTERARLGAPA